jgi:hypothetical protein
MKFDAVTVENQTASMTTLAQLLGIIGVLSVVVGCIGVAVWLVTGITGSGMMSFRGPPLVATGLGSIIVGVIQLAIAASLRALRAIAVNCAKLATASDGTYINVRARKSQ